MWLGEEGEEVNPCGRKTMVMTRIHHERIVRALT